MDDEHASVRHQLAILCRRKKSRTSEWSRDRPTEWRPTSVINPEDGQPFTDAGAWEFAAACLERNEPLHPVELEAPAGKWAYAMAVREGSRVIYIKLQLGSGKVIGRSFHYSTTST
jgi:hypothetical protein